MNTEKFFLNFANGATGAFTLETVEDHDVIFSGNLHDIPGADGEDWQNVLDDFFQKELGIVPEQWVVG